MKIRKKSILTLCKVWLIACIVCQLVVSCLMSSSEPGIGVATHWTSRRFGMIHEQCILTGPAYGNETRMYVKGTSVFENRTHLAYLIVELENGRTVSWGEPQQGAIPFAVIQENVEVVNPLEKIHTNYAQGDIGYHRAWRPPNPFTRGGVRSLFYHTMAEQDISKNIVRLHCSKSYRAASARIYFPFVYIGALLIDFITAPLQFIFFILVSISLSGFRQT